MAFYGEQVLPRVQDLAMRRRPMQKVRARVCAGLEGDVVELGFGTGLNAPCYPPEVRKVFAIEPSSLCLRIAGPRIAQTRTQVEVSGLDGQRLDLPSGEFDAVLSTWTLCTIPDIAEALGEARRVLRPGGSLHFVEHGRAPDPGVARWQARIEPLHKRVAGGCHITRQIPRLIEEAGFDIEHLDTYYFAGEPKLYGFTFEGRALSR